MWFPTYPYLNINDFNLDWLLKAMSELQKAFEAFVSANSIEFADPLLHDMSKSYHKNTIVLDSNGNAFLSKEVVPIGIKLDNSTYWLMIFDYEAFLEKVNKNFTGRYYRNEDRAKTTMSVGDWLTFDDVLYRVISPLDVDTIITPNVNVIHFTLEDFIKEFITNVTNIVNQYKNDIDTSELNYKNEIEALFNAAVSGVTVDSEVIVARVGAGGAIYPTLGDAIRTQIREVSQSINRVLVSLSWELNGINISGNDTANQYSIRTISDKYYFFPSGAKLVVASNVSVTIFRYTLDDSGYTFYDRIVGIADRVYNLSEQYYYRFALASVPTSTLSDTSASSFVRCFDNDANKIYYDAYQKKNGSIISLSAGALPNAIEGVLPTQWWINMDCIIPMHALIKSVKFDSAVAGFRQIQIGIFRVIQRSDGDDKYLELVKKINYAQTLTVGVNEIPVLFETKSQVYVGIRPLTNDTIRFNRDANNSGYGYYSFTNTAWLSPEPLNLSYSLGAVEYNRGAQVHRQFYAYQVDYYFKDVPYNGKKLAIIGDSIQDNTLYRAYYLWYEMLCSEMGFTFVTYCSGGRAYDPSQGGGTGFAQYVNRMHEELYSPDAIVIFGGLNDYNGADIPLGDITSAANYNTEAGCIKGAFNLLQTYFPYTPVLIVSPTPACANEGGVYVNNLEVNNAQNYDMEDFVNLLHDLAYEYHFYFLDVTNESALNPELGGTSNPLYRGDYMHPSTRGHMLIAAQLRPSIISILAAQLHGDDYYSSPWL